MPIINRIASLHDEITAWRRDMHENPELLYDVHYTAALVASKLKEFGCDEVVTGIGQTGVVGVIKGRKNGSGKVIGLRADMDALPIEEETDVPYKSKIPGKMHACGHDGHTAMLLGAAKYLAETRNFDGTAIMIFQPAEEGGAGGAAMVKDGLMTRFGIQEVYGMHNMPGIPLGTFAMKPGPIMAAADKFEIVVQGRGGHGAMPHQCIDPVVISAAIIQATQAIVGRNVDPLEGAVVSITALNGGETFNVIPDKMHMMGTVRTFNPAVQDLVEQRLKDTVVGIAAAMGGSATIDYQRGYPVTSNHAQQTEFAAKVASEVAGPDRVDTATAPLMGAEDFSFMLLERPGAYIFIGNGDTAGCHHPAYNFQDDAIPAGSSYWAKLVEMGMPA